MEYKFNCSCGQLLVRGNPVHKDITCNCSKTFTFFNGEYREYELGQIVTNSNIEVLDRFKCISGIGLHNKIKWECKNDKKRRIIRA